MEQKIEITDSNNTQVFQAGGDVHIHQAEKQRMEERPFSPSLHNQTPPEPNFVGRVEMLKTITDWYKNPAVHIGALIGWGGVGKSALARKWFDSLAENNIQPDGIFWWGFYGNASLERFLDALLEYLVQGRVDLAEIKGTWQKVEKIKGFILMNFLNGGLDNV